MVIGDTLTAIATMLVLISGADEFLRRQACQQRIAAFLTEAERQFGVTRVSVASADGSTLRGLAESPGLFADRRVVVLEGWEGAKTDQVATLQEVGAQIAAANDTLVILNVAGDKREDARLTPFIGARDVCAPLKRGDAAGWLQRHARDAHGVSCDSGVARLIVESVGADAGVLASEFEKLLLAADGSSITPALVQDLVVHAVEASPYAWYDAVADKDIGRALARLRAILLNPEYPGIRLLVGLGIHLSQVAVARARLDSGDRASDVARSLGGWMGEKYTQQAQRWEGQRLARAIAHIGDADLAIKRGRGDVPTLQSLVAAICAND